MRNFTLKKFIVSEIVLLAVFVIGLMISYAIVLSRSYIKLSQHNEVPASGFSFSMPQGGQWRTSPTLKFAQNSYFLTAVQNADSDKVVTSLTVTYLLAAGTIDVNDWLKSRVAQLGKSIGGTRRIKGQNILTHAVMIKMQGQSVDIFYGIAALPGGRNVMIEVVDTTKDADWGWNIVTKVAGSFVFEGNPLLQEGAKIIASIRGKGIGQLLGIARQENYFLVREDDRTEGFETTMYARMADDAKMNVRMIDSYYVNSLGGRESVLQTNDRFDRFLLRSNTLNSSGARGEVIEVRLDDDAAMTVRMQGGRYAESYVPGPAAIPDAFEPAVFKEMLADGTKEAIIDFISSEGRILPAIVRVQDHQADSNDRPMHTVTVKYFGETDMAEEITFDADGQIERDIVSGSVSYILNRSSRESILNEFPLWLDYFMNIEKLLMEDAVDGNKNPRRIVRNVTML